MNDEKFSNTGVTQIIGHGGDREAPPMMSYTAVTSHNEMAQAFVNHVLSFCNQLIPEKVMTTQDLIAICHTALDRQTEGVPVVEGKYLRARISEQLSRARRYNEIFSVIAIKLFPDVQDSTYETVIDALREKLRQSDVIFTFTNRIMLVLPHTDTDGTILLLDRISELLDITFDATPILEISYLPFPSPKIKRSSQVLDWAENQLR